METTTNKSKELCQVHQLDFLIAKERMFVQTPDGIIESPYFGLRNCKTNEIINTVKEGYTVSQNEEIVELVVRGMEKFGNTLTVSKAGSLNGGRKVFMQLGVEGLGQVANDVLKRFVTIIDSNDGSTSLSIGIGDLTMSCANQFNKFYKKGDAKFRHTETMAKKLQTIPYLIEIALNESLKQMELYNKFASTPISKSLANEMVKHILGYDRELTAMEVMATKKTRAINIMDELYNHIEKETNGKGWNLWGLHSGVTSFTTHEKVAPQRDNGRIESILNGSAYLMNNESLQFVTKKLELV